MNNRRKQPRETVTIPMSNYGSVANPAWVATMGGKLWLITEKKAKK